MLFSTSRINHINSLFLLFLNQSCTRSFVYLSLLVSFLINRLFIKETILFVDTYGSPLQKTQHTLSYILVTCHFFTNYIVCFVVKNIGGHIQTPYTMYSLISIISGNLKTLSAWYNSALAFIYSFDI